MGLLDSLLGGLGGNIISNASATKGANVQTQQGFRSDVQIQDGDAAFDTVAEVIALVGAAGVWTNLWEYTVPAQQAIRWGYGSPALAQNQGYMWFVLVDEGTGFDVGVLRLAQMNARRTKSLVIAEVADRALHLTDSTTLITATPTDKNTMTPLPEKREFPKVGEDSLLIVQYRLIAATTAVDNAGFKIPVTIYQ